MSTFVDRKKIVVYTNNPDHYKVQTLHELDEVAIRFVKKFPTGGIFLVEGEMGAGKTTFIGAVCRCLGLHFQGSPTFSLVNEYVLEDGRKLFHFDLYRLQKTHEIHDIGFEEYIETGAFVFIEWPEKAMPLINQECIQITIRDESGLRLIKF